MSARRARPPLGVRPRVRHGSRRGLALVAATLAAGTLAALAPAGNARAQDGHPPEGRTLAVVVDRSASLRYADPRGDARAALAFALALAARPADQVVVTAPALDPPVGAPANDLAALAGPLRTIVRPPADAGGADLAPVFAQALERAETRGALVVYTADELEVVDAEGHAPEAALEAARQKTPRPDRNGVNEAARDALREALAPVRDGNRLFGLRAPLPAEARSVPFLDALGARSVDVDAKAPLVAARALALLLGRTDLPLAPAELTLEGGTGRIDVASGTRVVLLGRAAIATTAASSIGLDVDRRFWIVDADGPFDVTGDAGAKVAWLGAPRVPLALDVHAWRLASGAIEVRARPGDATAALQLVAVAGGAPVELARSATGDHTGRLPASADARTASVEAHLGSLVLPPVEAPIVRAALAIQPTAESPLVAGAPVKLVARSAAPLPAELLTPTLALTFASGANETKVELNRSGDGYEGTTRFAQAGRFTLTSNAAGELALELTPTELSIAVAPVLTVRRLGEPGPVVVHEGRVSLDLEVSLAPAPKLPAPLGARLDGLADAVAELSAGAAATGDKAKIVLFVSARPDKLEPCSVELEARLPQGVVARVKLPLELRPPTGWTKWAALGVTLAAILWAVIAVRRKRALERLLGQKQLRGLGPSGKITPERYLLKTHLVSRRSAVVAVGRTSVVIDLDKTGAATARGPEGVELLKLEKGSRREPTLALAHGTAFAALRDPSIRRFVYLENEPTADELTHRFVPEARSFTEEEQQEHSDLYVLLEEGENVPPESGRLLGGKSARIGGSARMGRGESGRGESGRDSARTKASDRLRIDRSQVRGDSARVLPGDSARMPETVESSDAADEPIIVVSDEGKLLTDREVVVLDPGSSDDEGTDEELDPVSPADGSGNGSESGSSSGSRDALHASGDALASTGSSDEIEPFVDPGSSDIMASGDETEPVSSEGERVIPSSDAGPVQPAQDDRPV